MSIQALSLELNLFCIAILSLILYRVLKRNDRQIRQLKFRNMVIWHIVVLAVNTFSPLIRDMISAESASAVFSVVTLDLYYITLNMAIRSWFICLIYSMDLRQKTNRGCLLAVNISATVMVILNATSQWTHVFYYYQGGHFEKGPAANWQLIYLFATQLVTSVAAYRVAKKTMSPGVVRQIRLMATYPVIPFVFMVLRFAVGNLPYLAVSNTMAILFIYIGYLEQQISIDPLTGLNNRDHLFDYILSKMNEKTGDLCVLMMDVNRFKHINDTYGHVEGDHALQTVAGVLRESVRSFGKQSFLARYGGDEFIIVTEADRLSVAELKTFIHKKLKMSCEWKDLPYQLTLSIGEARLDKSAVKRPDKLVDAADQALYEEKRALKGI